MCQNGKKWKYLLRDLERTIRSSGLLWHSLPRGRPGSALLRGGSLLQGGAHYGERVIIFLEKNDDATFELREVDGAGCDKLWGGGGSGWSAFLEARG